MDRKDAILILKAAGATDLQAEQFVGVRPHISVETVAGAELALRDKHWR